MNRNWLCETNADLRFKKAVVLYWLVAFTPDNHPSEKSCLVGVLPLPSARCRYPFLLEADDVEMTHFIGLTCFPALHEPRYRDGPFILPVDRITANGAY
jgi:hypothetical protein